MEEARKAVVQVKLGTDFRVLWWVNDKELVGPKPTPPWPGTRSNYTIPAKTCSQIECKWARDTALLSASTATLKEQRKFKIYYEGKLDSE